MSLRFFSRFDHKIHSYKRDKIAISQICTIDFEYLKLKLSKICTASSNYGQILRFVFKICQNGYLSASVKYLVVLSQYEYWNEIFVREFLAFFFSSHRNLIFVEICKNRRFKHIAKRDEYFCNLHNPFSQRIFVESCSS